MCVRVVVHNCHTQHSTEQFSYLPSYPPDKHQSSDAVYWRGGGVIEYTFHLKKFWPGIGLS